MYGYRDLLQGNPSAKPETPTVSNCFVPSPADPIPGEPGESGRALLDQHGGDISLSRKRYRFDAVKDGSNFNDADLDTGCRDNPQFTYENDPSLLY